MAASHTLTARAGGAFLAEGTVTPDSGANTFALPFTVDNSDFLDITVEAQGAAVTACTFTSASGTSMILAVTQGGTAQIYVRVILRHSSVR